MKLGDICSKIGSGATPRGGKDSYKDSGTAIIRSQNVLDWSFSSSGLAFIDDDQSKALSNVEVKQGDVLLNITGDSVARACMVPSEFLPARVNQHVAIIRANEEANNLFLLAWLQANKGTLLKLASSGATRNALTKRMLENLDVNLPPIDVQDKAAAFIDSIQAKIALNTKLNGYLEKLTSLLFDHYVDNCTTTTELCSFVNISSGKRPPIKSPNMTSECTIPLLGASGQMGYTNRYLTQDRLLVIGRVGTHGVVQRITEKAWPSDNTLIVRSPQYETTFQLLRRIDYASLNRGSTQPLITQRDLKACLVPQLDDTTLERFEREAGHLMDLHDHNAIESDRLAKLRDLLLPRLLSGDIDVSKVEGCTP